MGEQRIDDEIEIDLVDLFHVMLDKLWYIILSLLIGAMLAGTITRFAITPQFQSTSMIYVLGKTTSLSSAIDLQLSRQLTVDFEVLATSRPVVERVIMGLDLDMTYEELLTIVEVTNPDNSSILKMTVTYPDPKLAKDIANEFATATAERIAKVMVTDKPSTVEEAVIAKKPVSPSMKKNVTIGGLIGALLMVAVIVVRYLLDDTISTAEDAKKYLNMNVMASIPLDTENPHANKKRKNQAERKKKSFVMEGNREDEKNKCYK